MEAQNTVAPIFSWAAREDDPKTNNKIILNHLAFKGAQTGSLAMTLFHLVYFRRRIQVASFFRGHFASTTSCAIIYGVGGYYHIKNDDPAINYDRAFRLQYNSVQNRCDKFSVIFSGVSVFMGLFMWPIPLWQGWVTYEKMLGWYCFAFGQGAFVHYITKNGPGYMDPIEWWRH